jgi:molybdenum cofactor cytidylyltransferase
MINTTSKNKKFSAIILAAGLSTRMGHPKLLLPYDKEFTFVEQIVKTYEGFGCEDIYVVVNESAIHLLENQRLDISHVKLIVNPHPEWQKFYSLQLAVKSMINTHSSFIQNIDNPFVKEETLTKLSEKDALADYIIPTFNDKGGHPFLASMSVLEKVKNENDPQIHFKEFMQQFKSLRVPVNDEKVVVNINSKMEYETWFSN